MNFGSFLSNNFLNKLKAVFGRTYYQYKFLQGNQAGTGLVSDLQFDNLEIGKKYRIIFFYSINWTSTAVGTHRIQVVNGLDAIGLSHLGGSHNSGNNISTLGLDNKFTASATTITFEITSANAIQLRGAVGENFSTTWARLEELPNDEVTTKFNA